MSDHLIAEANRHAKALPKMTLPTTKPNDLDLAWYRRECELLQDRNEALERENAALREKFMFAESEIILLREDREELRELAARMAKEMRETDHEFCSLVDYDNLQNKI
jgi:predicted RNase H-like nuclease (RuvC/YqgF family)